MSVFRSFLLRVLIVLLPRGAVTMTLAGSAIGYQSSFVDMTYVPSPDVPVVGAVITDISESLPHHPTKVYPLRKASQVHGLVWHHTATPEGEPITNMATYHIMQRGWAGLAYHYAIQGKTIFKCNNPLSITNQTEGMNTATIGVVLVGNYEENEPSEDTKKSALKLDEYLNTEWDFRFICLHKDTKATLCPGKYAEKYLRQFCYGKVPKH